MTKSSPMPFEEEERNNVDDAQCESKPNSSDVGGTERKDQPGSVGAERRNDLGKVAALGAMTERDHDP